MGVVWNEISANASGGTEIIMRRIESSVEATLLDNFQIFPSRVRGDLDPTKIRIYHAHDTAQDPEASSVLSDGGWRRFHRVVFVSNSQMMDFIRQYGIDWERCAVMRNAIDPIDKPIGKVSSPIRLIYTSTPQRGLDILCDVFDKLSLDYDVELDVFSSYMIYGWKEADVPFQPLFDRLRANPRVVLHGARPNAEVRDALSRAHVFAYPSTWTETSCICLMEAMSAGLACVHPNLGALYETSAALTQQYQFVPDKKRHAELFEAKLREVLDVGVPTYDAQLSDYARRSFGWDRRVPEWNAFLTSLLNEPRGFEEVTQPMFTYRVNT